MAEATGTPIPENGIRSTMNWANEAQDSTAPVKRRMMPVPVAGKRLDPQFRDDLVDAAAHRIQAVWNDAPAGVDAETLAQSVVAAQEFLWIARGFPVEIPPHHGDGSTT